MSGKRKADWDVSPTIYKKRKQIGQADLKNDKNIKKITSTLIKKNETLQSNKKSTTTFSEKAQNSNHKKFLMNDDKKETTEKSIVPSSRVTNFKQIEVSQNWKKLIKSGKVKVTKGGKKFTDMKHNNNNDDLPAVLPSTDANKLLEVWFDDVDEILLESSKTDEQKSCGNQNALVKSNSFEGVTKTIAVDCEMVGVGAGGKDSIVARVSLVNHFGQCIYDKYVKPVEPVTDYRTFVSGIRPSDLIKGENFKVVQNEVCDLLKGRILIGHAVNNDLKVLFLDHPKKDIRDTSRFKPFRAVTNGGIPSLKKLADKLLGVQVQTGEHNSIQDAQAAMRLYTMYRKKWEASLKHKGSKNRKKEKAKD